MKVKITIIEPETHKPKATIEVEQDQLFEEVRKIIGGWVEVIYLANGLCLLVDEEGKMKGKPVNKRASEISKVHVVVGTVVLTEQSNLDSGEEEEDA